MKSFIATHNDIANARIEELKSAELESVAGGDPKFPRCPDGGDAAWTVTPDGPTTWDC